MIKGGNKGILKPGLGNKIIQQKYLFLMAAPFLLVVIFNYIPIWGWIMAFMDYKVGRPLWEQKWVGFANFIKLFEDPNFHLALRNTLVMSVLSLLVGFTIPIIFALLLNEIRCSIFKKTVQTISYLPHFVSWVVVAGIVYKMLSTDGGPINDLLASLGVEKIQFMGEQKYFWGIVVLADLWKELGWNTIIFLAAITSIDPTLYEAAKIDGAGRFRQMRHITLPGIANVIIVLLILSIGHLLAIGFEKQMLLSNPLVMDSALVIDLYAIKYGLGPTRFPVGIAIGVVNSIVSLILLFSANALFKRKTGQSVM